MAKPVPKKREKVGLGDLVKKMLNSVGIKKDCEPCEKRRKALNKIKF
jgi:hypothetical protein